MLRSISGREAFGAGVRRRVLTAARARVRRPSRRDVALAVIAAALLTGCRLLRPEPAADLRVEVSASRDGFDWASPGDQRSCAAAEEYPAEVAGVLREVLSDGCAPCGGRRLSFRLFLLNEPVGRRAEVVSLVLLRPEPQESGRTLAELSAVLSRSRLPALPGQRPRCTLQVSITPPRPP